ncbi:hypothetical protein L596_013709 [Steinernema carpocapsae]|uniref:Uncharacterized protein n=1 Tax=Steinernema carpocapsae TaxID=34508 RepID=A0A4U5P1G3_STECR|nr:hypothetical protein L596_013709 [Steinernema carpocapsae]
MTGINDICNVNSAAPSILTIKQLFVIQGDTKNSPCGTRQEGCVWLRRELSGKDYFDATGAVGPVGDKFTREHERGVKSWFFLQKTTKIIRDQRIARFGVLRLRYLDEKYDIPCENVDN